MNFDLLGHIYQTRIWKPHLGRIGDRLAFDTETELATPGRIPGYVIGQAFAGGDVVYFIRLQELAIFFDVHAGCTMVMHNAPFDTTVVENEVGFDFHSMIQEDRLLDTGLLFRLHSLATEGRVGKWSLDHVSQKVLGLKIDKEGEARKNFGKYRVGNFIDYEHIPKSFLRYGAIDPIATFEIANILLQEIQSLNAKHLLSHKIQLMGAVALDKVSRLGIGFDLERKDQFLDRMQVLIDQNLSDLKEHGYVPGTPGVVKAYEAVIKKLNLQLPTTNGGRVSQKRDHLEEYRSSHPFVDAFLSYGENKKFKDFVVNLHQERIHTRFNSLLNTGRTSSSEPNIQNLPRKSDIRPCFYPGPGYCFLQIDYAQLELRTLAQVLLDAYGSSRMADLINDGVDLHLWFGSEIAGRPAGKKERQYAKACNFGFPGGLGIASFVLYAKKTYGISLTETQAQELKEKWLSAFPEMRRYLADTIQSRHDFTSIGEWCDDPGVAYGIFKRIIAGKEKKDGGSYSRKLKDWAFSTALSDVAPHLLGETEGSPTLLKKVLAETVVTRSGRIRASCTYSQARNTPFQGLAADGCKIALYNLIRAKYRIVNFVHDEFIIEIPLSRDLEIEGNHVKDIVLNSMKEAVPDVKIDAEYAFTDRWHKDAYLVRDDGGKIRLYTDADQALKDKNTSSIVAQHLEVRS